METVSPLAPERFPAMEPIAGVRLAAHEAGIRYTGRNDLMVAELAPGSTVAGLFTLSQTPGHPVVWCRQQLIGGHVRASWSIPAIERVHRARRLAGRPGHRGGSGAAVRLQPTARCSFPRPA